MTNKDPEENQESTNDALSDALSRLKNGDLPEKMNPDDDNTQQQEPISEAEENFLTVSANMPEAKRLKELKKLQDKNEQLKNALNLSESSNIALQRDLDEANNRIATLIHERTKNIDSVVDTLRQIQTSGTVLGPVGGQANSLKRIFSTNTQIKKRIKELKLNANIESDIKIALDAFKHASGDVFEYKIEVIERSDFWHGFGRSATLEKHSPAKLILVDLKGKISNSNGEKLSNTELIVCYKNKIFNHQHDSTRKIDYKKIFMSTEGHYDNPAGGCFWFAKTMHHPYETMMFETKRDPKTEMQGPHTDIAVYMDYFIAQSLNAVIPSNEFNQAIGMFQTMDLL